MPPGQQTNQAVLKPCLRAQVSGLSFAAKHFDVSTATKKFKQKIL